MPNILSRQRHRTLKSRKGNSSANSFWLFGLRNPMIWTSCLVVLSIIGYMYQDVNTSFDVTYLKGSTFGSVMGALSEESSLSTGMSATSSSSSLSSSSSSTLSVAASATPQTPSSPFDPVMNAQSVQTWRKETERLCQHMMTANNNADTPQARAQKEEVEKQAMSKLTFPESVSGSLPPDHQPYQYCRNIFIDLGTNIGDSIGYFVDNALDVCTPIWMDQHPRTRLDTNFPRPHLDVTTLEMVHGGVGSNPLLGILQKEMRKSSSAAGVPMSSGNFCVYGMEGNPEFTDRLQKLENHVMNIRPRPVQHLHIHTESVVTAVDGPTKLFLDKHSVEHNFWGSSILSSQQDAVKSAKDLGNGQVFSADVQGITLSTLTKRTALAFKPGATEEETKGGLLIIKMDVEGAEYQVLKEVAASNVLCDYVQKGNRVVMIVEYHNMSITDAAERNREKAGSGEAQAKLTACGVEFGKLQAFWA